MFLIVAAVLLVTLIYLKLVKPYDYWITRGVKQRKQTYLLGDNAGVMFRTESFWDLVLDLYNAFPGERYVGMYQLLQPILMVRDPDLIKQITVKDFDHFVDHQQIIPDGVDELFNRNLFSLKGNRWRDMRSTLSPSFTTSKMKVIFNLVSECAVDFTRYFSETHRGTQSVELKDICTRYTNDVIATVAFGIKCDSLREPKNEFYLMGKITTTFDGFWTNLKVFFLASAPRLAKILGMSLFTEDVRRFFKRIVKETLTSREAHGIVRPDMIQLLMEARKGRLRQDDKEDLIDTGFATVQETKTNGTSKIAKEEITDLDITAQALIFFFAGFDTVSSVMSFLGHELVANPEVQRKLRKEIDDTLVECKGVLSYEALLKMKYMDMVVSETLRKWSPATNTDRVCTRSYTIEPTKPSEKPIHLAKGDVVWIPINGMHWDPQYYPEPERFDPERFNDENKDTIKPYTYLPFGAGPRNCIGSRFALIETKTVIFHLLSKFDLVAVDKTQIPLKISKKNINPTSENGFWIGLKPRVDIN